MTGATRERLRTDPGDPAGSPRLEGDVCLVSDLLAAMPPPAPQLAEAARPWIIGLGLVTAIAAGALTYVGLAASVAAR